MKKLDFLYTNVLSLEWMAGRREKKQAENCGNTFRQPDV